MLRFDQQVRLPTLSEADYVHDIAYDYYGTRLALCTSSLRISIFSAPTGGGGDGASWTETARMERAHAGPIWRLSWGHPEHGEPLASCSEDCSVNIWFWGRQGTTPATKGGEGNSKLPRWEQRAQIQGDGPVTDVRFAPAPLGLKLAACTADGRARIYYCGNAMNLRTWDSEELETVRMGINPSSSSFNTAMSVNSGPTACSSAALDWMPVPLGGGSAEQACEAIALAGRGGRLAIWGKETKESTSGKWKELASADAHPSAEGGVKDVAWCPNMCRRYEIVATCGAGAALWRIEFAAQDERYSGLHARKQQQFTCHMELLKELMPPTYEANPVWRCSWNLTGTTLALCPEGTEVSVWKADASLEWRQECGIELGGGE